MTWKSCQGLEILLPICLAFASTIGEIGSKLDEILAGVVHFLGSVLHTLKPFQYA